MVADDASRLVRPSRTQPAMTLAARRRAMCALAYLRSPSLLHACSLSNLINIALTLGCVTLSFLSRGKQSHMTLSADAVAVVCRRRAL